MASETQRLKETILDPNMVHSPLKWRMEEEVMGIERRGAGEEV